MTDVASALPSAGWYDDPTDTSKLRWWDGSGWTENAAPKHEVATPTAPPLSTNYAVDERRAALSPRRAARLAERAEEHLATVTPLHPAPSGASINVPQPAVPQSVVPPSAETQAAAAPPSATQVAVPAASEPTKPAQAHAAEATVAPAASAEHMPQLGLVPDSVSAPSPTDVAVAPSAAPLVPAAAGTTSVPQPGSVLTGPPTSPMIGTPEPAIAAQQVVGPSVAAPASATPTAVPSLSDTPFFTTPAAPAPFSAPSAALAPAAPAAPAPAPAFASPAPGAAFAAPAPAFTAAAPFTAPAPAFAAPAPFAAPTAPALPAPALPAHAPAATVVPGTAVEPVNRRAASRTSAADSSDQSNAWRAGLAPRTSGTAAARLLAVTPWLIALDLAGAGFLAVAHPRWFLIAPAAFAIGIIGTLILGDLDRRSQRKLGWERSAPPLLLMLGWFTYLVARQLVLRRQGARVAPLLIAAGVNLVTSAAAVVAVTMFVAPHAIAVLSATVRSLL